MILVYSGFIDMPCDSIINFPVCTTIEQTMVTCYKFINEILIPIKKVILEWEGNDEKPDTIYVLILDKEEQEIGTIVYNAVPLIQ